MVREEFEKARSTHTLTKDGARMLPVECSVARGKSGTDYFVHKEEGPWVKYGGDARELCWYSEANFRSSFSEYQDMPVKEVAKRLYQKHDVVIAESAAPWTNSRCCLRTRSALRWRY